jgi:iron complex outermembrane receptor protein
VKILNILLISTIFSTVSYSQKLESMNDLLETFVHNSDLSKKTHLENAGNITIFTRVELERMQAHNLRDIIKSLPFLNYAENRWAITDPAYVVHRMPFNSNSIRIYIDDQEISAASYGSGLFYLGNMDIGFIDHIEIYTINPSFEYSTEPAHYLIKLYSKTPDRDRGSELKVSVGSYGYNQESYQYADIIDGVSYFGYLSRLDDRRKKYNSFDTSMSRNQERYFFFNTISSKNHHLQLQAIAYHKDMFMGMSEDGETQKAKNQTDYLHIGYENNSVNNLKLSFVFEKGISENQFKNDYEELKLTNADKILTAEAQYKWYGIDNNELIMGTKHRYKNFIVKKNEYKGVEMPRVDYNTQTITSLYMEDHYALGEKWLVSLGTQYSYIYNNSSVENQNIWLARLGIIYSDNKWVAKTFLHYSKFLVEPYLYNTPGTIIVENSIIPEKVSNITQEVQYQYKAHKFRTILSYNYVKDMPASRARGYILNEDESKSQIFTQLDYDYNINIYSTFVSSISYSHSRNLVHSRPIYGKLFSDGFDEYKAVARMLNHYGKLDLFNELIYNYNSVIQKNYLDYSAGIKYYYSDKLTLSLKGENILNRARKDIFKRGKRDLETKEWNIFEPLLISPIDQKVYMTVEYLF